MLDSTLAATVVYFKPPADYFWQWEEDFSIVGWSTGKTIGYTEDILGLLKGQVDDGLPSFGAILLVLAACKDWKPTSQPNMRSLISGLTKLKKEDHSELRQYLHHT